MASKTSTVILTADFTLLSKHYYNFKLFQTTYFQTQSTLCLITSLQFFHILDDKIVIKKMEEG